MGVSAAVARVTGLPASGEPAPVITDEVKSWLPERTPSELAALHHHLAGRGDPSPIPVWRRGSERLVLDDHDRAEYCQAHRVPVHYEEYRFDTEDDARKFVLERNHAHRSRPGIGRRYVTGAIYNLERKPGRRTDLTSPHAEGKPATEALQLRFGCSLATLERDGRLARQIDEAAGIHGHVARALLLDPRHRLGPQHIQRFAALPLADQDVVLDALRAGEVPSLLKEPSKATASVNQDPSSAELPAPLCAAIETVLEGMKQIEQIVGALAQSAHDGTILSESARRIATGHAALRRELRRLRTLPRSTGSPAPTANAEGASLPSNGSCERSYSLHDLEAPAHEMSTAGIVQEISARLALADSLEQSGQAGIPLGLQQTKFVTLEELRRRAHELENELARRHSISG